MWSGGRESQLPERLPRDRLLRNGGGTPEPTVERRQPHFRTLLFPEAGEIGTVNPHLLRQFGGHPTFGRGKVKRGHYESRVIPPAGFKHPFGSNRPCQKETVWMVAKRIVAKFLLLTFHQSAKWHLRMKKYPRFTSICCCLSAPILVTPLTAK